VFLESSTAFLAICDLLAQQAACRSETRTDAGRFGIGHDNGFHRKYMARMLRSFSMLAGEVANDKIEGFLHSFRNALQPSSVQRSYRALRGGQDKQLVTTPLSLYQGSDQVESP